MANASKQKKVTVRHPTSEAKLRKWVFDKWPAEACGLPDQVEAMEKVVQWLLVGKRTPEAVANILPMQKRK